MGHIISGKVSINGFHRPWEVNWGQKVTSAITLGVILVKILKALLFGTTDLGLSKRKIFSSSMSLKKWFDCKFEVTVIQIYGMRSFNFLHLILILYRHLGRPWAGSWWNGHNKCLFPLWGTLFSTPSPQKNQKTNSDHHFGKKRTVLRTWKRKNHKKI